MVLHQSQGCKIVVTGSAKVSFTPLDLQMFHLQITAVSRASTLEYNHACRLPDPILKAPTPPALKQLHTLPYSSLVILQMLSFDLCPCNPLMYTEMPGDQHVVV
jgi:hypothetical protein